MNHSVHASSLECDKLSWLIDETLLIQGIMPIPSPQIFKFKRIVLYLIVMTGDVLLSYLRHGLHIDEHRVLVQVAMIYYKL